MRKTLSAIGAVCICIIVQAQSNFFKENKPDKNSLPDKWLTLSAKFYTSTINLSELKSFLFSLPAESTFSNRNTAPVISVPMPDGSINSFHIWQYDMMEPALAGRFPEIKTFAGIGSDDPYATIRADYSPDYGFRVQILSIKGDINIEPLSSSDIDHCISYYSKDYNKAIPFSCKVFGDSLQRLLPDNVQEGKCRGSSLYTFRLAVACTGEYATAVAAPLPPSTANAMAAIVTTINRVNGIYEKELAMRFILVANNNQIVFLNPSTDPYTNGNESLMMDENQTTINSIIGFSNYDVGQVFGTGTMSAAFVASVCSSPNKAKAVSGLPSPTGDLFDVDRVCHNLGHLFSARHTYNSNDPGCANPVLPGEEPGSGTTIMAAAGTCGPDNIQPQADPYFHVVSFNQITDFLISNAAICRNLIPNGGNNPPQIVSMPVIGFNIPQGTPFTLTAIASDPDGDPITYSWETTDRGPVGPWNGGNTVGSPFFKSRVPKTTGSRTFPDMDVILAGYPSNPPPIAGGLKGEILPIIVANIDVRVTIRDNRGGVINDGADCNNALFQIGVSTIAGTGPFKVNLPNGGETWSSNSQQVILWDVAGSSSYPINNSSVNILLSVDGGYTYPYTLAFAVPNDGFEIVTMPVITTNIARIKVEAAQNVFFNISNANFSIASAPVGFEFGTPNMQTVACPAPNSISYLLGTVSNGGYNTAINLSATGVPNGASLSFSANPLTPGSSTTITLYNLNTVANGIYYITINGVSGSLTRSRVLVVEIQQGASPTITVQPSDQSDCVGGTVTFNISSPNAISFQWQLSTDAGFSFTNITPGGNSSSLVISNITAAHLNYRYRCIVRGQCNSIISNIVKITVLVPATIITQPQSVSVCNGLNASFVISASSGASVPLYQWQVNRNDGSGFVNIAGAAISTLQLSGVTLSMNGFQYRCLVFNPACSTPVTSATATLTVYPQPIVTLNASPYTKLLPGLSTILTATVTGSGPFAYRWYYNNGQIGGAIASTLNVNFTKLGTYKVETIDSRGCLGSSANLLISDSASTKFFIYPNPARNNIEFSFYNASGNVVHWQIIIQNSLGQVVKRVNINSTVYYPNMPVYVGKLPRGIYSATLWENENHLLATSRFVLQ